MALQKAPPPDPLTDVHALPVASVLDKLATTPDTGLSTPDAISRRSQHGRNQLRARKPVTALRILLNQFESPVVWLLGLASIVAFFFGEWKEAIAVVAVLVINATIGFVTEHRATRSMEALRKLGSLATRVRRDGHASILNAEELVPGDIVLVEGGDIVTADLRLVESSNLAADESALTGESVATSKSPTPVAEESVLGDRSSMLYKGTSVTRGGGTGVVVATGMQSELGHISKLVEQARSEHSPLERQLQKLSGQLIWFTLAVVTAISIVGMLSGRDVVMMIQSAIALAIAAIPEGLPVVATMALARGMLRMARQNALVERLSAVETLGSTTIILTDKTGTLTENRMQVHEVELDTSRMLFNQQSRQFVPEGGERQDTTLTHDFEQATAALVLCNNAELNPDGQSGSGDPLELALLEAGYFAGTQQQELNQQFPRISEDAFDSDSRMMATEHQSETDILVCVKGAPESVINSATHMQHRGERTAMDSLARKNWLARTNAMAKRGMRVLAVASKHASNQQEPVYENLTLLGLVGLYDPPRNDIRQAIDDCHSAGIRIIMMTGDHAETASNIANAIGISEPDSIVVEGQDLKPLEEMADSEKQTLRSTAIFARVNPAQKLDLVTLHQRNHEIVAMTGDGVNDAPALKKADIGIAMGLRGTQVARESAAMVLRDDDFRTIVAAIRGGRNIFRNIQRFVSYLLSCNLSEVLVVGGSILLGLPMALLPLQILFLNLVTDVFPAFALGLGEQDRRILKKPPRDPRQPIITRVMWLELVAHSVSITMSTLLALVIAEQYFALEAEQAITVSFLTLAFAQLWHVINMRDAESHWLSNVITQNGYIWVALVISTLLVLAAVYIPALSSVLQLHPPAPQLWAVIIGISLIPLFVGQAGLAAVKILKRRERRV